WWDAALDDRNHVLDAGDHVERRSISRFLNSKQRGALPVDSNDVRLWGEAIANPGDIFYIDGRAAERLDRQVIQLGDGLWTSIGCDVVFQSADLCGAGWKDQVLRADRINHIQRRKTLGL